MCRLCCCMCIKYMYISAVKFTSRDLFSHWGLVVNVLHIYSILRKSSERYVHGLNSSVEYTKAT